MFKADAPSGSPTADLKNTLAALLCILGALSPAVRGASPDDAGGQALDIINYIAYSDVLASSGQPTAAQFQVQAEAGVQRVVYLAFTDHETSLANEDRVVRDLGMAFVQVPVVWVNPTVEDFRLFAAVMAQGGDHKTLVHCQVNWRASSFSFLYRVIHDKVPMDDAVVDLTSIWTPTEPWRQFIVDVLDAHGLAPDCELCELLQG